jgi:hypothetical protein
MINLTHSVFPLRMYNKSVLSNATSLFVFRFLNLMYPPPPPRRNMYLALPHILHTSSKNKSKPYIRCGRWVLALARQATNRGRQLVPLVSQATPGGRQLVPLVSQATNRGGQLVPLVSHATYGGRQLVLFVRQATHRGGPVSIPDLSTWNLWWNKCY